MTLQVAGITVRPAIVAPLDRGFLPASLFTRKALLPPLLVLL